MSAVRRLWIDVFRVSVLGALYLLGGCRSVSEFNPYVSIGSYDTVVVEDFEGPESSGFDFAERLARAISRIGLFRDVARIEANGRAIRIKGTVLRYERGNAALRIKYGRTMGNARFKVQVDLEDFESGDFIASIVMTEEFETVAPRAPRKHDVNALAERAARKVADNLLTSISEVGTSAFSP